MSDEKMRTLEKDAATGDENAIRALVNERRRTGGFDGALDAFLSILAGRLHVEFADLGGLKYKPVEVKTGRRYVRVFTGGSTYCFIDRDNGNILMPGGKMPEPTKTPRGNIYGEDPLVGCEKHGVVYLKDPRYPRSKKAVAAPPILMFTLTATPPEKKPEAVSLPKGTKLRVPETFGSCRVLGDAIEDKGKHFTYRDRDGKVKTAKKDVQSRYAQMLPPTPHVEPCHRCADHPETIFREGNCGMHGGPEPCERFMSM